MPSTGILRHLSMFNNPSLFNRSYQLLESSQVLIAECRALRATSRELCEEARARRMLLAATCSNLWGGAILEPHGSLTIQNARLTPAAKSGGPEP
jgi:hypothetical protein